MSGSHCALATFQRTSRENSRLVQSLKLTRSWCVRISVDYSTHAQFSLTLARETFYAKSTSVHTSLSKFLAIVYLLRFELSLKLFPVFHALYHPTLKDSICMINCPISILSVGEAVYPTKSGVEIH